MKPLSGVRIIEFDGLGPVTFAGMMLADLGAEVVRLTRSATAGAPVFADVGGEVLHRGRAAVEVNLKDSADHARVLDLVAQADAVIEGFRPGVLERLGIDPAVPYALFVGRITRQKGLAHLLRAATEVPGQLVLCAGAPDTPEIAAETAALVAELQAARPGVVLISDMLPRADVVQLLSHATAFVCPSVYEPLGIVNLEAMACGTAVVASDVGGIPEVVVDGATGVLVHYDEADPRGFEADLAAALTGVLADPVRAAALGRAGRERAVAAFDWDAIAVQTLALYASVLR